MKGRASAYKVVEIFITTQTNKHLDQSNYKQLKRSHRRTNLFRHYANELVFDTLMRPHHSAMWVTRDQILRTLSSGAFPQI